MESISLNKTWSFKLDPNNKGLEENWFEKPDTLKAGNSTIKVPSCWEEKEMDYQGVAWYFTEFEVSDAVADQVCRLCFAAANYRTSVWINGQQIGTHEGGYTPFYFEIHPFLKYGTYNQITVRIVSPIITQAIEIDGLGPNDMPHWRGGLTAGIWQCVHLEFNKDAWIESTFYKPDITKSEFKLELTVQSKNPEANPIELTVQLKDADGNPAGEVVQTMTLSSGANKIETTIELQNPILWDCENPHLYRAKLTLKKNNNLLAQAEDRIGLKEFTYEKDAFYLNGKRLYLRGGFWEGVYAKHQSYPEDRDVIRREIALAKAAGLNLLRPWRRPVPPIILEEADEAGMLIIGSPAVECMSCWPTIRPETPARIEYEIRQLILRDRNHPSIIWWEMFNEVTRKEIADLITPMSLMARQLDPTRLILDESGGWSSGAHFYKPKSYERQKLAELHSYVRAPVNERHWNLYQNLGNQDTKEGNTKIKAGVGIFVSEFGFGGLPEIEANFLKFKKFGNQKLPAYRHFERLFHDLKAAIQACEIENIYPEIDDFCRASQAIQARGNRRQLEALLSNENINGYCIHAFTDGDWILGAGLIDNWQNPKAAYYSIAEANKNSHFFAFPEKRNLQSGELAKLRIIARNSLDALPSSLHVTKGNLSHEFEALDWQGDSELYKLNVVIPACLLDNGTNALELIAKDGDGVTLHKCLIELFVVKTAQAPEDLNLIVYDPDDEITTWLQINNYKTTRLEDWRLSDDSKPAVFLFVPDDVRAESDLSLVATAMETIHSGKGNALFLEAPCEHESRSMLREYEASDTKKGTFNKLAASGTFPFKLTARPSFAFWESSMHIVKDHPIFDGLPVNCMMDEPYHEIAPVESYYELACEVAPSQTITWFRPEGKDKVQKRTFMGGDDLWYGTNLAIKSHGKGLFLLSTFILRRKIKRDPIAARLFANLILFAHQKTLLPSTKSKSLTV